MLFSARRSSSGRVADGVAVGDQALVDQQDALELELRLLDRQCDGSGADPCHRLLDPVLQTHVGGDQDHRRDAEFGHGDLPPSGDARVVEHADLAGADLEGLRRLGHRHRDLQVVDRHLRRLVLRPGREVGHQQEQPRVGRGSRSPRRGCWGAGAGSFFVGGVRVREPSSGRHVDRLGEVRPMERDGVGALRQDRLEQVDLLVEQPQFDQGADRPPGSVRLASPRKPTPRYPAARAV
jgi:hypothetical protein